MEQHRAPELVLAYMLDESQPLGAPVDVVVNPRSEGMWPAASCPLQPKLATPGDANCKEGTTPASFLSPFVPTPAGGYAGEESALEESALPDPGHDLSSLSCDSVILPASPRDLHLDARYMANTWSYEAPPNMYALWTPPPGSLHMEIMPGGTALVMHPCMHLQGHQHGQFQHPHHQQLLDQPLEPGLPLQMSPIHDSGVSSLLSVSGTPAFMTPYPVMMQQPAHGSVPNPGFSTTPTAVNLSDIMVSGDLSMFLAPNGSPTRLTKQYVRPKLHTGGAGNVKNLTLNELRPHFNKPMAVVAKELGVCITLMKKICRRNGLVRWPHRRIRSLVNRISSLQILSSTAATIERKRFLAQIAGLREELSTVIQNPNEKSHKARSEVLQQPVKTEKVLSKEIRNELLTALTTDEIVGQAGSNENGMKSHENGGIESVKVRKAQKGVKAAGKASVNKLTGRDRVRTKKRKPSFGLHAHQPPPIKIPRHDELPSISRLRSQSVPERKLRGDRRYGRGRDIYTGNSCIGARPSTTTHRNGRRGSISSILNGIPE
uniref:RWP-RK domain-containing protein n=1 Tax=Peronospora matthiolae TaxID=2874970 RepID=A0AAV1TP14_9STRA